jgi:pimeloyl-ACP methyl ester carboxylesterase
MHTDIHKSAARQTVLLLHSSGSSSRQWSALADVLGARYNVRTVDFHGHGMQPAWSGPQGLRLADDAALAEPLVQAAGRVHLVGHSYGGAVALKLAELHPQCVRSVVVYEPVLFNWLLQQAPASAEAREVLDVSGAIGRRVQQERDHAAAEAFVDYWSGAGTWQRMPPARQNAMAARMRAVHPHFEALYLDDLAGVRAALATPPLLYLTGSKTAASTRRLGALARTLLPHARHDEVAGAGHMGPITHPEQVNARIAHFIAAHSVLGRPVAAQRHAAWQRWVALRDATDALPA